MNPTQVQTDVNNARNQGNALQAQYNQQAGQAQGQYQDTYNQSQTAQKSLQDYTKQIAGQNYGNIYGQDLSNAQSMYNFDPKSLALANKNLLQTQTAMQYAPQAAAQAGNYYGGTAGQAENAYQNMAGNLNTTLANQSNAVGQYQNLLSATQNQANQQTTQQLAGQQQGLSAYEATAQNATNIMNTASQTMTAIEKLQQDQGTVTSGQIAAYQNAYSNYVTAQAAAQKAAADAALEGQQQIGQQQTNQQISNYMNSQLYKNYVKDPSKFTVTYSTSGMPEVTPIAATPKTPAQPVKPAQPAQIGAGTPSASPGNPYGIKFKLGK